MPLEAELARLAPVPMRKDPQQKVRAGGRVVRALHDERRSPARIEALADVRLCLRELEALFVPLQNGVAADDALLVPAFVRTPAVLGGMLSLTDRRRTGVK